MPLARIITRTPQHAVGASDYLRSLGYMVETVSPEEFRVTPAELELNLERCGPSEAVERAFALVESSASAPPIEAPTVAEPPAPPQKNKIAIAYDITGQPVEFAEEEEAEARTKTSPSTVVSTVFARVADWLRRPRSELRQRSAERRALKLEAGAAREREEIRRQAELASERLRQEVERQREAAELADRPRREDLAGEEKAQQEQAKVGALHEAMMATEPEAAPEQPPPQILPPEIEPLVPPANDNLSVLPPAAEQAPKAEPAPVAEVVRPQVPLRIPERPRLIQPRRRRAPIAISRASVATVCGLSLLVLMGFVAYANRRPASPLPLSALRDVKQDVPFGAASITPMAAASKPKTVIQGNKRSAAVRLANRKPSGGQPGARRSSRDDAPNEVVVRHLQPTQPQPSTAKLKRHSDLD